MRRLVVLIAEANLYQQHLRKVCFVPKVYDPERQGEMTHDLWTDAQSYLSTLLCLLPSRLRDGHLRLDGLPSRKGYVSGTFDRLRYLNQDPSKASWESSPGEIVSLLIRTNHLIGSGTVQPQMRMQFSTEQRGAVADGRMNKGLQEVKMSR